MVVPMSVPYYWDALLLGRVFVARLRLVILQTKSRVSPTPRHFLGSDATSTSSSITPRKPISQQQCPPSFLHLLVIRKQIYKGSDKRSSIVIGRISGPSGSVFRKVAIARTQEPERFVSFMQNCRMWPFFSHIFQSTRTFKPRFNIPRRAWSSLAYFVSFDRCAQQCAFILHLIFGGRF